MLFVLIDCKSNSEKDFVFNEFKTQIERHGMKIDSVDEMGLIYVSQGELTLMISLDNLRRDYKRDNDKSHISDFVQTLTSYSVEIPSNWADAKGDIYISLFPNNYEFNDFIHHEITGEFSKVYVHSGSDKFSWITTDDLKKWNITEAELDKQANINADILLAQTKIAVDTIESRKLGLIEAEHESLKGALLFAPAE